MKSSPLPFFSSASSRTRFLSVSSTPKPPQPPVQALLPAAPSDSKPSTSPVSTSTTTPAASSQSAQAASTQPVAPAQTPAPSGGSKRAASYAAKVRAHIESFKVYPPQARRRHQTGMVGFSFTIDRQGRVLSARITRSSGVPALDQEFGLTD
jgi:protein TonB